MSAGGALQVGSVDRIDERDRQIVAILTKDARSSLRDIAKDVTLSPSSIRTRIARLVENGFIERFTVDVDRRKLGFEIQVVAMITCKPGFSESLRATLNRYKQVSRIYWTAGPAHLICICHFRDMLELSAFITGELEKLEGIDRLETMFLMSNTE
ncbi:MAG: Lrp/AsnC family transcriptional regulator [Candidatus Thorarchaeota archaeon]|jgi:DNA-binding Lrp family transcriptional regulator